MLFKRPTETKAPRHVFPVPVLAGRCVLSALNAPDVYDLEEVIPLSRHVATIMNMTVYRRTCRGQRYKDIEEQRWKYETKTKQNKTHFLAPQLNLTSIYVTSQCNYIQEQKMYLWYFNPSARRLWSGAPCCGVCECFSLKRQRHLQCVLMHTDECLVCFSF